VARPTIALLTDFGTHDHYAGTLKGVVLSLCPDATLVDITHEVPPHDVLTAGLELAACFKYFPAATIFLVVVDPGVGSARRGLAAEAGDYRFVAPDNGVLSLAFRAAPPRRVVDLTERRYARPTVSRTFEGRDRFAPAAGWLARGVELTAMGRPVTRWVELDVPAPALDGARLTGQVLRVDRFGNLVTNIDRRAFEQFRQQSAIQIAIDGRAVERLVATYAEAGPGALCALFGSSDHLEVAVNGDSAARVLGLGLGAEVRIDRG
jgi:S-adenosylmethionine hydrolase